MEPRDIAERAVDVASEAVADVDGLPGVFAGLKVVGAVWDGDAILFGLLGKCNCNVAGGSKVKSVDCQKFHVGVLSAVGYCPFCADIVVYKGAKIKYKVYNGLDLIFSGC